MRLRLHLRFLTSFSHAKIGIPIGIVIAIAIGNRIVKQLPIALMTAILNCGNS